jgi:DNA-binding GntR family transcriptional regulator
MSTKKRSIKGNLFGEKNLTYMAYQKIKEMMFNYEIIPGQRLIFVDFAKRLKVSRTPVNNALNILANEGFLDFVPNQGYWVHQITRGEADALHEIREIIELGAIGKVIQNLTPEKLEVLKRRRILYENSIIEQLNRGRFALDQEYHASYIQMAGNQYLTEYFREVYQRLFFRNRIEGLPPGRAQQVVLEHEEIFKAIGLRDVKSAKRLIKSHIKAGKEYIYSSVFGKG